jgi:hypothetical protein
MRPVTVSDDGKAITVSYSSLLVRSMTTDMRCSPFLLLVIPSSKLKVTFQRMGFSLNYLMYSGGESL